MITNSIGMKLVKIPAGEFLMGNPESTADLAQGFPNYEAERMESPDEKPQHKVRITKPFYLGQTEVTLAQFQKFVDTAKYQVESEKDGTGGWGYNPKIMYFEGRQKQYSYKNPGFPQQPNHPVVNVT